MADHYDELPTNIYNISDFEIISSPIGSGTYGSVIKARHRHFNTKPLVLKTYQAPLNERNLDYSIVKEFGVLNICQQYNIAGIVKCYGLCIDRDNNKISIILESLPKTLTTYLDDLMESSDMLFEQKFKQCFQQTLQFINEFHKLGFIHSDLKSDNIMVDDEGNIKIIDFGLACLANYIPHSDITETGNSSIRAPDNILPQYKNELLDTLYVRGNRISFQSDIYALALIFGNFYFTGHADGDNDIFLNTEDGALHLYNYDESSDYGLINFDESNDDTVHMYDLIKHMLVPKTDERYTAEEALQHEYFFNSDGDGLNGGGPLDDKYYHYTENEIVNRLLELKYLVQNFNMYKDYHIAFNGINEINDFGTMSMILNSYLDDYGRLDDGFVYGYDSIYNMLCYFHNNQSHVNTHSVKNTINIYNDIICSSFNEVLYESSMNIVPQSYFNYVRSGNNKFVSLWTLVSYYSIIYGVDVFSLATSLVIFLMFINYTGTLTADSIIKALVKKLHPDLEIEDTEIQLASILLEIDAKVGEMMSSDEIDMNSGIFLFLINW